MSEYDNDARTILDRVSDDLVERITRHGQDPECPRSVSEQEQVQLRHVRAIMFRQAVSLVARYTRLNGAHERDEFDESTLGVRPCPANVYGPDLPSHIQGIVEIAMECVEWLYGRGESPAPHSAERSLWRGLLGCHDCDIDEVDRLRNKLDHLVQITPVPLYNREGLYIERRYAARWNPQRDIEEPIFQGYRVRSSWKLPLGASWYYPFGEEE